MKKLLALVLVIAMAMTMVTLAVAEAPATPTKVGICIYKYDDNFMTLYRTELQSYLESKGCAVTVVDGKNDQAEQTNQINAFIAEGVDVLIINLVQSTAAASVIELVKAANIPTVLINRQPTDEDLAIWDKVCYVGADARQSGTFQGEIILETPTKGDINANGKVDYVMIIGDPENIDAQYRTEYSIKALTDAGSVVNELFAQRGDWDQAKGQELAATALAQFNTEIDVIFCNNDGMALGALQAIKDAGRVVGTDIYLVGVDALPEVVELVDAGEMTGTVLNDHISQSHKAADVALEVFGGATPEKVYMVDYTKIVKK